MCNLPNHENDSSRNFYTPVLNLIQVCLKYKEFIVTKMADITFELRSVIKLSIYKLMIAVYGTAKVEDLVQIKCVLFSNNE